MWKKYRNELTVVNLYINYEIIFFIKHKAITQKKKKKKKKFCGKNIDPN